jgi:hypothetical protein
LKKIIEDKSRLNRSAKLTDSDKFKFMTSRAKIREAVAEGKRLVFIDEG